MGDNYHNIVKITMFKTFTIEYNGQLLKEEDIRSERILSVLCYFLYYYNRPIMAQELIDQLGYFEDIEKPIGALKNLIYRLRILLRKHLDLSDFIETGKGGYYINDQYQIDIDAFTFEQTIKTLETYPQKEQFDKSLSLYAGKFLPSLEHSHFFMAKATYYHSTYISLVEKYCYLLDELSEYQRMYEITRTAIQLEKYDEILYFYLILSQYKSRDYRNALKSYKSSTDFLYQSLGVRPSDELSALYEKIKEESRTQVTNINDIQKEIVKEATGAFLCDYGIFKDLYNLQTRTMNRLYIVSQICLITVEETESKDETMNAIQRCLVYSLRKGDVVSRLSGNQFIILLLNCNYEDARMVIERVLSSFQGQVHYQVSLQEVTAKK